MKSPLQQARDEIAECREHVDDVTSELNRLRALHEGACTEFAAGKVALEQERDRLRVALKEATALGQEYQERADRNEGTIADLRSDLANCQQNCIRMWQERDDIRAKLTDTERSAIAAMAPTASGKDAQAWAEEVAALTAKLQAAEQRADMMERNAAKLCAKLDALSAFVRGGVAALVRG